MDEDYLSLLFTPGRILHGMRHRDSQLHAIWNPLIGTNVLTSSSIPEIEIRRMKYARDTDES